MTRDRLSGPAVGVLLFAGWLAFVAEPAAHPGAGPVPPLRFPPPGAALVEKLDRLHVQALRHALVTEEHARALNVGVHPEPPPPRWWKGPRR